MNLVRITARHIVEHPEHAREMTLNLDAIVRVDHGPLDDQEHFPDVGLEMANGQTYVISAEDWVRILDGPRPAYWHEVKRAGG